MALDYMKPAWGETIMDLSCGSGLFSRRFIKSGKFKNVLVSDFSENMLRQSSQFIAEDPSIDPRSALFQLSTVLNSSYFLFCHQANVNVRMGPQNVEIS